MGGNDSNIKLQKLFDFPFGGIEIPKGYVLDIKLVLPKCFK